MYYMTHTFSVPCSNLGHRLSSTVLRYGDLGENCLFFLPLFHLAPPFPMLSLEFLGEVNREETSHGATL